jgi:hypothetical protein
MKGASVGGRAYTVVVTIAPVQSQGFACSCFVHVEFPAAAGVTSALSAVSVATGAIEVMSSVPLTGFTQDVMSGISVEKMLVDVPAESNGAGSRGSVRSADTPTTTEMLASTRTRLLISLFWRLGFSSPLGFFVLSSALHWSWALVVRRASRRGRSKATVTRALSLSLNSKPIGMVGVKATLRAMSASETLVVKGSAFSVAPLMPVMAVFARSPSSTLIPAPSGIWFTN